MPGQRARNLPRGSKPPASLAARVAFLGSGVVLSGILLGAVFYEVTGGAAPSRAASTSSALPLSSTHFTPVEVTQSSHADADGAHKLISLKVPPHLSVPTPPPVFSIYLKDSDIQVERPYTPLKGLEDDGTMLFWVKRYDHGEVGRWFHRRKVGETVEIRGPVRTFDWKEDTWDEVVMVGSRHKILPCPLNMTDGPMKISGGTGITPFYQLLHNTFAHRPQAAVASSLKAPASSLDGLKTHITLMHASSSSASLPPPVILDDLKSWAAQYPEEFTLKTFVDRKGDASGVEATEGRIDVRSIDQTRHERGLMKQPSWLEWLRGVKGKREHQKKVLFVVCGPER
ncbi:hypothetical protein FRB96_007648 [Tulasnella sp. 330]|nr:hypothetical protein FRB96_007648 [Tulasnella sp. 330]KAG8889651.1 hypothetical protein FRB98_003454 [Tulasnella sp. 332]